MITNTARYITLEMFNGELINGNGGTAEMTLSVLAEQLSDGQDDGHTVEVFEVRWDERGLVEVHRVTDKLMEILKRNAECLDDPDGVPTDERDWIHPLAEKAGFKWTPTEYEVAEMQADFERKTEKENYDE